MTRSKLLTVQGLKTYFRSEGNLVKAVDGVTFDVAPGEIVGIVGESGSGKTVMGHSILRLIQSPPGYFAGGSIYFGGKDLLHIPETELRTIRGNRIAMIFQDPMSSLNPYLTVGRQLTEVLEVHKKMSSAEARRRAIDMLGRVGISEPEQRILQYPHQFSGGMCQRVMIAMALLCEPALLIADEPTTALDVTIQAQILSLLNDLRKDFGTSVILITHDLAVLAGTADRVLVMYAGKIVEEGKTGPLLASARHPYTRGLLASIPRIDGERVEHLSSIEGLPPDLSQVPPGCAFHPRCPIVTDRCRGSMPELETISSGRSIACWEAGK